MNCPNCKFVPLERVHTWKMCPICGWATQAGYFYEEEFDL